MFENANASAFPRGSVALVGAGPGDADLLTARAARRLADADVVLHDNLVSDEVLALASRARLVDVGKVGGGASTPQALIHRMLIVEAQAGHRVVRLKGGDPFVFGRGGEEAIALREAGVAVEVVPGISASIAAAGAAGIPVTHRTVATHFSVVTCVGADDADVRATWVALARAGGTVVFMMGLRRAHDIAVALIDGGIEPGRPAAIVSSATTRDQQVLVGTLANLAALAEQAAQPATIVVGDVVALRDAIGGDSTADDARALPPELHNALSALAG